MEDEEERILQRMTIWEMEETTLVGQSVEKKITERHRQLQEREHKEVKVQ